MLAAKERLKLFDPRNIHNSRAVNAPELFGIELRLHGADCLPHHRVNFAGMKVNVLVICFDPIDLVRAQECDSSACFDDETLEVWRLVPDAVEQCAQLESLIFFVPGIKARFGMPDRLLEPRLVERF